MRKKRTLLHFIPVILKVLYSFVYRNLFKKHAAKRALSFFVGDNVPIHRILINVAILVQIQRLHINWLAANPFLTALQLHIRVAQWRKIPDPVRKIAAYRMAWHWAVAYAPPSIRPEEAARILASVGRVESLFDIEKVIHRNSDRGKEDLGFLQISEVMRQRLGRLPEFRDYEKDDYLTPWVSIRAGSYSLFSVFLKGAGGDILEAIGHYNAGKHGLAQRAEKYLNAVLNQYRRAFIDKHYSPTLRFLLTKADPRYFCGIQGDVLFKNQQLIHAARTP
jgi:hypothetical protein